VAAGVGRGADAKTERYQVLEGKTPIITRDHARELLAAIANLVVGHRGQVIIATLIYTAARAWGLRGKASPAGPLRRRQVVDRPGDRPLFLKALRNEKQLTARAITGLNICRMVKRRLLRAGRSGGRI